MNRLSRRRARAILLALLLLGGLFRFQGLDWDAGHHLHPDERFISMVEEKLTLPEGAGAYFDSKRSTLNPYNRGEGSFVYGTLPMLLAKAVAPLFGKKGYDGTHLVGRALSGLFDLAGPRTPAGTTPQIGVLIKVENADTTVERVAALGGRALPAFDVGNAGRMAVCFDPNGANFDIWEAKQSPLTEADGHLPGAPSWFETMTSDVQRATRFYAELFGWDPVVRHGPVMDYTTFRLGSEFVAGLHEITPRMGAVTPHWTTYFTVADVDESVRLAVRLCATLVVPLIEVKGRGRFGLLRSPQGVAFHIISYER